MWGGLEAKLAVLVLALMIDQLLGEPPPPIHPTVWMGRFIEALKARLRGRLGGVALAASTVTTFTAALSSIALLAQMASPLAHVAVSAYLLKTTFAVRSMEEHVKPIVEALRGGRVEEARRLVARIVSRDTSKLSAAHLASATIESISESTVDGVASPLLYYAAFGLPGAIAYRAVNTLDSMVGYREPPLDELGWASARLDTALNLVPARLTGLLMVVAAWLTGLDHRLALGTMLRDHDRAESLNAGWPMSAAAGALGVWLECRPPLEP
ncbi:hypothetical protein B6U99_06730 [Candidatus Geothermarchaeota archaeon ex4572_27]|nr:MAG: hypothetical protein B6U99_06730 [Candidatus Geothermarchaeota archaeon ex4572_27]